MIRLTPRIRRGLRYLHGVCAMRYEHIDDEGHDVHGITDDEWVAIREALDWLRDKAFSQTGR